MEKTTRVESKTVFCGLQLTRNVKTLHPAWRLMGKANPFVPWMMLEQCEKLEDACKRAEEWKKRGKFYLVHVRAN